MRLVCRATAVALATLATIAPSADAAPVPAPTDLRVVEDDHVATLEWNGHGGWQRTEPPGVGGYEVIWGRAGGRLTHRMISGVPAVQLQPLEHGVDYRVEIRSIGRRGERSRPLASYVRSDPTRVNALRASMTAFFDDFNRPAGALDSERWSHAWSACNTAKRNGSFVNDQLHAHTALYSGRCDRGQAVVRPRAALQLAGRTATIAFDLDGLERRDFWYLDVNGAPYDIGGHVAIGGENSAFPRNMLRLQQTRNTLDLIWFDGEGRGATIAAGTTVWKDVGEGELVLNEKVQVSKTGYARPVKKKS